MSERDLREAEPVLRARLEALGAKRWQALAGVPLAWAQGCMWMALGERFVPAPRPFEVLSEALRESRAELDSEEGLEQVMDLVQWMTEARVTRTTDNLDSLTLDQPGPEVIHSGTVGKRGQALWEPPRRGPEGLVFFANLRRKDSADFVRIRVDFATRSFSVEVVDEGWYEVAAYLG